MVLIDMICLNPTTVVIWYCDFQGTMGKYSQDNRIFPTSNFYCNHFCRPCRNCWFFWEIVWGFKKLMWDLGELMWTFEGLNQPHNWKPIHQQLSRLANLTLVSFSPCSTVHHHQATRVSNFGNQLLPVPAWQVSIPLKVHLIIKLLNG